MKEETLNPLWKKGLVDRSPTQPPADRASPGTSEPQGKSPGMPHLDLNRIPSPAALEEGLSRSKPLGGSAGPSQHLTLGLQVSDG